MRLGDLSVRPFSAPLLRPEQEAAPATVPVSVVSDAKGNRRAVGRLHPDPRAPPRVMRIDAPTAEGGASAARERSHEREVVRIGLRGPEAAWWPVLDWRPLDRPRLARERGPSDERCPLHRPAALIASVKDQRTVSRRPLLSATTPGTVESATM